MKIRLNDKEEIAMITWNNLDTLESFKELSKVGRVDIKEAMSGDNGAKRVKEYNIPMAEGFQGIQVVPGNHCDFLLII